MVAEDLKSGFMQESPLVRKHLKVLPGAKSQAFTFLNNRGIMQVFLATPRQGEDLSPEPGGRVTAAEMQRGTWAGDTS